MTEKYIGVNAFTSVLKERQKALGESPRALGKTAFCVLEETINKRQSVPTADVAPVVHGHWIYMFQQDDYFFYKCSVCGRFERVLVKSEINAMPHCHCGANMDEEVKKK